MRPSARFAGPTRLLLAALGWSTGLVACSDDEAPPAGPVIQRFEASPPNVLQGSTSTLSWSVSGARRLRLVNERGTILVAQDPAAPDGRFSAGPLEADERFILEIEGEPGLGSARSEVEVEVEFPAPVFLETAAVPSQILAGQAAALRWRTESAVAVDVATSTGGVVLESGPLEGQVIVRPLASMRYTLLARGVETATSTTLSVVVTNRPPTIERFTASPPTISTDEQVGLTWRTVGAERVRIEGAGTATVVYDGPLARGSRTVRLTRSEDFVLTAIGLGGSRSATVSVTVRPPAPVAIDRLVVEPNPAGRSELQELVWAVRGAARLVIEQDGQVLLRTSQRSGRLPIVVDPARDTGTFVLTATAPTGAMTGSVEAIVHDSPVVRVFEIDPPAGPAGPRTVRWSVDNVVQLALFRDGVPVLGFPGIDAPASRQQSSTGDLVLTATVTSALLLEATSAGGAILTTRPLVVGLAEAEPNDLRAQALPPPAPGTVRDYLGDLSPIDVDAFAIDVPEGGSISARTSSGPGICLTDTQLTLWREGVLLAGDDNGGVRPCAAIEPSTHPAAAILAAGVYHVEVRAPAGGSYVLTLGPGPQSCGNGVRERPETCDDGARVTGDGCSERCALEAAGAPLILPAGDRALGPIGPSQAVVLPLDLVLAGQSVTATAASPDGTCDVVDTRIELLDALGASLVDAAGGGPAGAAGICGAIDAGRDRGARDLRPGRYYLSVRTENGAAGPVSVAYRVTDPACGNRLVETRAGEQCDDGNVAAGDGCSPSCVFEGGAAPEVEPNDRQAEATPTGLIGIGRAQLRGEIRPSGDDDVFSFEIPANQFRRISARTYTLRDQLTSCDRNVTDTRMYLEAEGTEATRPGTGELAFNDDLDPVGNVWCSAIVRQLVQGGPTGRTYYLRLQGWQDRGTATYFLDVELTP